LAAKILAQLLSSSFSSSSSSSSSKKKMKETGFSYNFVPIFQTKNCAFTEQKSEET